jgi:hypothetical protein
MTTTDDAIIGGESLANVGQTNGKTTPHSSSASSSSSSPDQPDSDTIKMFVGQVPRYCVCTAAACTIKKYDCNFTEIL